MKTWTLAGGIELRQLTTEDFRPLFRENRPKLFDKIFQFYYHEALSEHEKDASSKLAKRLGDLFRLNIGAFKGDEFIGWSFGIQMDHESFYMVNSAVFPEYRRKGLYTSMLNVMVGEAKHEGFQTIYSRHQATNSSVICAKLKQDFFITGMELSDAFGLIVHLTYYSNPLRRKALRFRAGELVPDEELKQYLGISALT